MKWPWHRAWRGVLMPLACLALAWQMDDPHLLPVRDVARPALIIAGLVGLALGLRGRWLPLALLWLAVFGLSATQEYKARHRHADLLLAADHDPRLMAELGEHLVIGYDDITDTRELARRGLIGGLFVTRRNIEGKTPARLRDELAGLQALRRQAGLPPLMIATDQEGGQVSRLSPLVPQQPPLASLAGHPEAERLAVAYGSEQAAALAGLGINANFSPVVDLKPDQAASPLDWHTRIAERAISSDPNEVTRVALPYSQALLAHDVIPTLKHFPGLAEVAADSHHFSAHLEKPPAQLDRADWLPFRRILGSTPAMLMVGHVSLDAIDPERPASLSRKVLTGLIREQWRYNGILISDDMSMAAVYDRGLCPAAVEALNASLDLLLVAYDWKHYYGVMDCLRRAAKTGELADLQASRARLDRLPWRHGGSARVPFQTSRTPTTP